MGIVFSDKAGERMVNVRVDERNVKRLVEATRREERNVSQILRIAINRYLDQSERSASESR